MLELMLESETMTYGARLKKLRNRMGLTQEKMAEFFNLSRPYYWQLEHDQETPGPKVRESLDLLERTPDGALPGPAKTTAPNKPLKPHLGGDIMRDLNLTVARRIPLLTLAQAGDVLVAWDNLPMHFAETELTDLSDPKAFAFKVVGDSGEPVFHDGAVMIVSPSREVENGDIVLVRLVNGDTLVKLYHEVKGPKGVQLASYNPKYPPRVYKRTEIEAIVPVVKISVDVSMLRSRRQF